MPIDPPPRDPTPQTGGDLLEVAGALAGVGRAVRDAVRATRVVDDASVVRTEGGDDVFGVDARADETVLEAFGRFIGPRWPGELIMEGFDDPLPVGPRSGPWRFIVDPVDGTRPYLAGKRSAWVLLGGGRDATDLEGLEVGAAVEIPTDRARVGTVAWAAGDRLVMVDEDLAGGASVEVAARPRPGADLEHAFVTVVHFGPGVRGRIGAWADGVLAGLRVFDDLTPCTGGALMDLVRGADAAVLDPRPLFSATGMAAHPYDLAAIVVARAAGVVVEALPAGPLDVPLDPHAGVAFAAYANTEVAALLRARLVPPAV